MENIYIGKCEHLYCSDISSPECLKRYFPFQNFITGKYYQFVFCNDYLKLLIQQENNEKIRIYTKQGVVGFINIKMINSLNDILCKHFNQYYGVENPSDYINKPTNLKHYPIRVIYNEYQNYNEIASNVFSFEEILNLYIDNQTVRLREMVVDHLLIFCKSLETKTSLNKYNRLLVDIRRINKKMWAKNEEENLTEIISVLSSVNEININHLKKNNYDTSK